MDPKNDPQTDAPGIVPPVPSDALAREHDLVRLETRVEELDRRLKARSMELETEIRAKERLRGRVAELTRRIDELQETASVLHREAVSSTSLARELDETLRVASEARRQLGEALEAERSRREAIEADLAAARAGKDDRVELLTREVAEARGHAEAVERQARLTKEELDALRARGSESARDAERLKPELKRKEEELAQAHRLAAQLRQKVAGHEAHLESMRSELDQVIVARAELEKRVPMLEQAEAEARKALEGAEQVRREGVEAFEAAREIERRAQARENALSRQISDEKDKLGDAVEKMKASTEAFKAELRARAEKELVEMRRELEAERARMHADIESEREAATRARAASPSESPGAERRREEERLRREGIAGEVRGYIEPAAHPVATTEPVPSPAKIPFQWDEEMRLLLWIGIALGVLVVVVGAAVLFRGG